jgi:hypothetical protein
MRILMVFGLMVVPLMAAPSRQGPSVEITILVDSTGEATIHERYRVPRDTGGMVLELLDRPCATIGPVTLSNYRTTVVLSGTRRGPWQTFRDSVGTAYNGDSSGFDLGYVTTLHGGGDIPVMHLTRPIPRREGEREGPVALTVTFRGGSANAVRFPPLAHDIAGTWASHFVAVPAFVHVERADEVAPRTAECAEEGGNDASDGGLSWRFWLLVGIMVLWLPIYLVWARRTRDDDT